MTEEQGSFLVDLVVAGVIVTGIIGGLWLFSGVWPPLVVVESGSMMHDDAGFGKVGTVDPGDLVLVSQVDSRGDVVSFVEGRESGHSTYGMAGDVVVYDAGRGTPIIHRAMAWVDIYDQGGQTRYTVEGYGVRNETSITIPELGLQDYSPDQEGYLTKGDSRRNFQADQAGGGGAISPDPVDLDMMIGKAQGELPWFGLIKLAVSGNPPSCFQHDDWTQIGLACAPLDLWIMLGFSVAFLLFLPNMVAPIFGFVDDRYGDRIRSKIDDALGREGRREGDRTGPGDDPGEADEGDGSVEPDEGDASDRTPDEAPDEPAEDPDDEGQV